MTNDITRGEVTIFATAVYQAVTESKSQWPLMDIIEVTRQVDFKDDIPSQVRAIMEKLANG